MGILNAHKIHNLFVLAVLLIVHIDIFTCKGHRKMEEIIAEIRQHGVLQLKSELLIDERILTSFCAVSEL